MDELGLLDDTLIYDHLDIPYSTHRRRIRIIIGISLIVFIITLILSSIFIYFIIKKQQFSPTVHEKIKSSIINEANIKSGIKFGDTTGFEFDDSLAEKFTYFHSIRGIRIRPDRSPLHWFQCFYSSSDNPENMIEGAIHGLKEDNDSFEDFFLDKDEKITKIQIKVDYVQLYQNDILSFRPLLIMAMRFYTTKGRTSRSIDYVDGQMYTEEFPGYTLGYISGKSGRYIDQIQFYWYKTL